MKAMPSVSSHQVKATESSTSGAGNSQQASAEHTAQPDGEGGHEEAIRLAAYACYEARGRTDGHALDDWLAAKEQVERSGAAHSGAGQPAG